MMRIMFPLEKKRCYLCHKTHSSPTQLWVLWPKESATQLQRCERLTQALGMTSFLTAFFLSDLQRHHWHKQPWLLHQLFPSSLPPAPSVCFSHLYSTCKLRKAHLTVTETLAHSLIFFSPFTELIFAWYAANFTFPPFLLYKQYFSSKHFLHIW